NARDERQYIVHRAIGLAIEIRYRDTVQPSGVTLERERSLSLELPLSLRDLLLRQSLGDHRRHLVLDRLQGGVRRLGGSADVDAMHTAGGVESLERVHGVSESQLFADALKETRAHSAPQPH